MNRLRATILFLIIMATGSFCIILSSCRSSSMDGMIIFTRAVGKQMEADYVTGNSWRYIPRTSIVALNPDKHAKSLKALSDGFYSARSPEISYDGKFMLFTAQRKQNDPWQIWEMRLADSKTRQVTSYLENCTDPAYLPGGRLLFSRSAVNDSLKAGHSLYTCNLNGSDIKRITFNPHAYFASTVLNDGRILTIDKQLYPDQGNQVFMILRPDGTKEDMFYRGIDGTKIYSRGCETKHGKIVFIESDSKSREGGNIVSISYNRPSHSWINLTSKIKGDFCTVFPLSSGRMLVSYRQSEEDRFALYEFDSESGSLGKAIYNDKDYDILEAVVAGKHERPKKLPSEVDMGVKSGLLLCQDINLLDPKSPVNFSAFATASGIEVLGIDSTLGVVKVEADGSFYLKVMADKPFRIQTIDKNGHVLHGPCGWIWLRPNERRGCIGCHEDNELVPENRIPLSVKKPPVIIPVHIIKVKEKKVSLE